MLTRRWIPTKLDLLVAQAIGYKLRPTSAFETLSIDGDIPFYHWTLAVGALTDGLELDAFDGVIYGTPTETGRFEFTVEVEEYGGTAVTRTFTLEVA